MKVHKTNLFFVFFLFVNHLLFAQAASGYQLPRIDEVAVEKQIPAISRMLKRNTIARYAILTGGVAVGAAATTYLFYKWFYSPVKEVDLETLIHEVSKNADDAPVQNRDLKKVVEALNKVKEKLDVSLGDINQKKWPWILRSGWFMAKFGIQTIASVFLWSLCSTVERYCGFIFKPRDAKWFISMQTHICSFSIREDLGGVSHEQFAEGSLLEELKRSAKTLDELETTTDARMVEQSVQILCSASSSLVQEVTRVIAFMQHIINTRTIELKLALLKSDAECFVHYLMDYTNSFCMAIESLIINKMEHPDQKSNLHDAVQKWAADFKNMVNGFARVIRQAEIVV